MKTIRNLLLFVGTALFLAACGTGGNGGGDGATQGTLKFELSGGPTTITVDIKQDGATVETVAATDGDSVDLDAGEYSVAPQTPSGYQPVAAKDVVITAGEETSVSFTFQAASNGDDNGDNDNGDNDIDPVTEAGVHVRVFPPEARSGATVSVIDVDGETVATESGSGSVHFELDAADDLRVVVSSSGYTTWTSEYFDLAADETEDFRVTLAPDHSISGNIAEDGITFAFGDVDGSAYAALAEVNVQKDATLVAAQTEEQICVTVNVADESGNPVRNAPVSVGLGNDFWDAAVAYPGGCAVELSTATNSGLGELYTDEDGNVTFSLQALGSGLAWQMILSGEREPIKVLVSAVGADDVARTGEFKLFPLNITHLMFGAARGDDAEALDAAIDRLFLPNGRSNAAYMAETRFGHDFGSFPVLWGTTESNSVTIVTGADKKQPNTGPFPVPNMAGPGSIDPVWSPGYIIYEFAEADLDYVEWDGACVTPVGGTANQCLIEDHSFNAAVLNPVSEELTDGSFSVDVSATYYFNVEYGYESYPFALKGYEFTVDWTRAFLTIDKYVDQHVLTWAGHAADGSVTLAAADESLVVGADDDAFVSTVHITVSNDSDEPVYNVVIRDAVPAELGVVIDSIKDGGYYDEDTHVVSWNFNLTPQLREFQPGDEHTFTFDVYARQKPGYAWEGPADENFTVAPQERYAEYYSDPYSVINGAAPQSVTAGGFFSSEAGSEPYVFEYRPRLDESTIHVVRPLFILEKQRIGQAEVPVGSPIRFDLSVSQQNRLTEPGYNDLVNRYPWEFNNTDTTSGSGHHADSSEARQNPYARGIEISDFFDTGLKFANATNFSGVSGGLFNIPTSPSLARDISWSSIDDLPRGVTAGATVWFAADQENEADDETWQNCAYLNARQLNQPAVASDTWYGANPVNWQDTVTTTVFDKEVPNPDYDPEDPAGEPEFISLPAMPVLEACADVAIFAPLPGEAVVTLTTNGEYVGWTPAMGGNYSGATSKDGYLSGDSFFYILTAENSGTELGTDVEISGTLADTSIVEFTGTARVYVNSGGVWTQVVTDTPAAGSFSFAAFDLPAGAKAVAFIPANAVATGIVDMETQLTYSNPAAVHSGAGVLPLTVTEETTVSQ